MLRYTGVAFCLLAQMSTAQKITFGDIKMDQGLFDMAKITLDAAIENTTCGIEFHKAMSQTAACVDQSHNALLKGEKAYNYMEKQLCEVCPSFITAGTENCTQIKEIVEKQQMAEFSMKTTCKVAKGAKSSAKGLGYGIMAASLVCCCCLLCLMVALIKMCCGGKTKKSKRGVKPVDADDGEGFSEGQKVMAMHTVDQNYYPATVSGVNKDGTYTLLWTDSDDQTDNVKTFAEIELPSAWDAPAE